jgi:membrane fusion protein, multidrug efflux system
MRIRGDAAALVSVWALAALCLPGCSGPGPPAGGRQSMAPPVRVGVHRIGASASSGLTLPGRIAAREEVTVAATIAARLTDFPRREGATFRAGEILARFEAPEAREALEAARASLESATLRRDLARIQEARVESLLTDRVASLREHEEAQAERRASEAAYAAARASVAAWIAGTAVEAPFDGVVIRRHVDVGASVAPGMPILDIRSIGAGELVAAVPESEVGRLANARVQYQLGAGPWRKAVLIRVDGMTDFTTRTRVARFRPVERPSELEPGSFIRIRLEPRSSADRPSAGAEAWSRAPLAVPASSIVRRGGLTGVYVIAAGRASLRWIRTGDIREGEVEVLSGLSAGDSIAIDPARLSDGAGVVPAPAPQPRP